MKKNWKYILYVAIIVILKQVLVSHIPINALTLAGCDDQLMVKLAASMLQGDYLGTLNALTFVKGISFPLFLAGNTALGISYTSAINIFYSLACIFFVYTLDKLMNKPWMKYVLITILIFNPIMYSSEILQRVYRNSLIPSQVLIIFASYIGMYINRKESNKKLLIYSLIGGLTLLFFWNTREDSIWILPFVIVWTIIYIINLFVIKKINIKKIIIFVLPIIILIIGNTSIKLINYKYYHAYIRIDEDNTSFANTIKTMYKVKANEEIEYVTNTREKINRLYEISPTLKSIEKELNNRMDEYSIIDRVNDKEVEDGWFWWTLRLAAEDAGLYDSYEHADTFYKNVTNEIETAIKEGKLETTSTMPSALMSPWKKGYTSKLLKTIGEEIIFTNSFKDLYPKVVESEGLDKNISYFETVTNNKAIYPSYTYISGYYYDNNKADIYIRNKYSNEELFHTVCNKNEVCNISFKTTLSKNDINIYLNDNILKEELDYNSNVGHNYNIYIDSNVEGNETLKKVSNVYVKKLQVISYIYRLVPILSIIGFISYIVLFIRMFKNKKEYIDKWLIVTSIILSYLVLLIGVGYNHISSCESITYMYLCATYPLILIFDMLSIFFNINTKKTTKK